MLLRNMPKKRVATDCEISIVGCCRCRAEVYGNRAGTCHSKCIEKAGLQLKDLDLIEINEAFSAQYLACQKELGFDPEIGNVNGGAVALGHPLAVSGVRISLTLIYELARRGKNTVLLPFALVVDRELRQYGRDYKGG